MRTGKCERAIRFLERIHSATWLTCQMAFGPYESYTTGIPARYRVRRPLGVKLAWSITWRVLEGGTYDTQTGG